MQKRILITGGSGFIGTNLLKYYIGKNEAVLNIDINEPALPEQKQYWRRADILLDNLDVIVREFSPTHIVHLAARTDINGKTAADYTVNVKGTENIIEAAKSAASLEKIIFASSMLVCRPGYIPSNDLDFFPSTRYGESKRDMELLIREKNIQTDWIIVRPTSIWGPWFKTPYKDFFDRVIAGKMYSIKKRACVKTYGFVLNTVYQIDKLLNKTGLKGQVFYLGDSPPLNINKWADDISDKLNIKRPPRFSYRLFVCAALAGDLLGKAGIHFPMTSFRLKNMTTDNIVPLQNLREITGPLPYSEDAAITITLDWINKKNNF